MKELIALAALALLPAVAHADDPCATDRGDLCRAPRPEPRINAAPSAPRSGSQVKLSVLALGSRDSTVAWDLDNDGAFDDATGLEATTTAGPSPVRVRET